MPQFYVDSESFCAALDRDWTAVDLLIVDLGVASAAVASRVGRAGVIAFGDPDRAGVALAARTAEFVVADPTDAELHAAVEAALASAPVAGVADLSDRGNARLNQVGADASRIAAALARLAPAAASVPIAPPVVIGRVRAMIDDRRARDRYFPGEVFGEPAWDMLLDLTIAGAERRDVAVSSLCIAAAVPTTTALRWIRTMCDLGLFDRRDDPADARRSFISLNAATATAMARYLAATS